MTDKWDKHNIVGVIGSCFMLLMACLLALGVGYVIFRETTVVWTTETIRINSIERVFMHTSSHYSALVREENNTMTAWDFYNPKVVADLGEDDPPFAEGMKHYCTEGARKGDTKYDSWVLHIHPAELQGAGWRKRVGKRTIAGQTVEVE